MAPALKKNKQDAAPKMKKEKALKSSKPAAPKGGGSRQRFVLIVGDEGGILVYMQGKKVVRRLFAPSPQGSHTEAMLELMRSNPGVPVSILVDVLDQQYVRQSFPPVSSMSVNGLVGRRLDRDFHAEDLKGSVSLGRDKTGRKEWNFLLIALVKTPLMSAWLDMIVELPNEMKGIYLVPVEATVYFTALSKALHSNPPLTWQLLVSHNKVSGFRQVVMRGEKIVFTRVTQALDDAIPAVIAGNIEQEIINTLEYLRRLDFSENSTLEAIVVVSQDVHDALDLGRFTLGRVNVLTPLDVADAMGFEQAALSADCFGDVVMAAAFATARTRVLRMMTAYGAQLGKIYMARRAVLGIAALAALVLIGLSGMNLLQVMGSRSELAETESKKAAAQPSLDSLKNAVSGLNKDISLKSAIVATDEDYVKNAANPSTFIHELGSLLTGEPRVTSMEWMTPTADKTAAGAASAPLLAAASGGGVPISVKVEFEFNGTYADTDALSQAVHRFMEMLKQQLPQYDITNEPLPWMKDAKQNIEISFDQQQPAASPTKEGQNHITLTFTGPKKVADAAPATGAIPPTAPPHGGGIAP